LLSEKHLFKILVIVAVAYGILAIVQSPKSTIQRPSPLNRIQVVLYFFAGLGMAAFAGIIFLICLSLRVPPQQTVAGLCYPLSPAISAKQLANSPDILHQGECPPVQVGEPGVRPVYAFLDAQEPNLGNPPEGEKLRPRARPKAEKKSAGNKRAKPKT
jgi:hypothetical protein